LPRWRRQRAAIVVFALFVGIALVAVANATANILGLLQERAGN